MLLILLWLLFRACLVLFFIHSLGSVGIGTVITAFLVGFILGIINKAFGKYRDRLLGKIEVADDIAESDDNKPTYVISISREYGSAAEKSEKFLQTDLVINIMIQSLSSS